MYWRKFYRWKERVGRPTPSLKKEWYTTPPSRDKARGPGLTSCSQQKTRWFSKYFSFIFQQLHNNIHDRDTIIVINFIECLPSVPTSFGSLHSSRPMNTNLASSNTVENSVTNSKTEYLIYDFVHFTALSLWKMR